MAMRRPILVLFTVALLGGTFAYTPSASAFPRHKCGSFITEHTWEDGTVTRTRIKVYNSNHLACTIAMKVIEAFFGPEDRIEGHGGPSEVQIYYTIKGFRGWRCYTGAGGGGCLYRGKTAAYLTDLV